MRDRKETQPNLEQAEQVLDLSVRGMKQGSKGCQKQTRPSDISQDKVY